MKHILIMTGLSATILTTTAISEDKPHPSIDYRQAAMSAVTSGVGAAIGLMKSGTATTDNLKVHTDMMAAGAAGARYGFSYKEHGGDTLGDTWENWDDFAAKLDKFSTDASALKAAVDSGDMAATGIAFKQTMSNCKACHDKYKKK